MGVPRRIVIRARRIGAKRNEQLMKKAVEDALAMSNEELDAWLKARRIKVQRSFRNMERKIN
jgi:hypothetical protein